MRLSRKDEYVFAIVPHSMHFSCDCVYEGPLKYERLSSYTTNTQTFYIHPAARE